MSDPIKPLGPGQADATAHVDEASSLEGVSQAQQVEHTHAVASAAAAERPQAVDPLDVALREVAADIRAGRVPDQLAASEAVIIRLVNLRYASVPEALRRNMILRLHEVLVNDPQFQAKIDNLIELAVPHAPTP